MKLNIIRLLPIFFALQSCTTVNQNYDFCLDQEGFSPAITGIWLEDKSTEYVVNAKRLYISCRSVIYHQYYLSGSFPQSQECTGKYIRDGNEMIVNGVCDTYPEESVWKESFTIKAISASEMELEVDNEVSVYKRL